MTDGQSGRCVIVSDHSEQRVFSNYLPEILDGASGYSLSSKRLFLSYIIQFVSTCVVLYLHPVLFPVPVEDVFDGVSLCLVSDFDSSWRLDLDHLCAVLSSLLQPDDEVCSVSTSGGEHRVQFTDPASTAGRVHLRTRGHTRQINTDETGHMPEMEYPDTILDCVVA